MRYISKTNIITLNGRTWYINARKSGVYTSMLKSMLGQLEAMMSYHSKLHVLRFDLRQYEYTETNERITTLNRRLFRWIKRHYKVKRIGFIWCREKEKSKNQHYHYVLMLDGHKIKQPNLILRKVDDIWTSLDGSSSVPKNCYYNLKRDDYFPISWAIFRISYLAKARGKGYRPPQTKDYNTSRIKIKDQKKG